mmetsp:Transcript_7102/g.8070  ORF Transcript_7102/g.8070 Transcript_7102/m.8070 type:complete len:252 (+) Transcript_7102:332-1087(+)
MQVIKGRSAKQIRERWTNGLDPNLRKEYWAKDEEKLLFELYLKFGSKWAKIKAFFERRTENQLKNRFYSILRKISTEKKKKSGSSRDEDVKKSRMEKIGDLTKYIPEAVNFLKANIKNLPADLSLTSPIILYTSLPTPSAPSPRPLPPPTPSFTNSDCLVFSLPPLHPLPLTLSLTPSCPSAQHTSKGEVQSRKGKPEGRIEGTAARKSCHKDLTAPIAPPGYCDVTGRKRKNEEKKEEVEYERFQVEGKD